MLNELGYDAGPADGVAGRRTINALNAFQRDNGLTVTGSIDKQGLATLTAIHRHAAANGSLPTQGPSVAATPPSSLPTHTPPSSTAPTVAQPASSALAQPSFDCALASTPTEVALCTNAALATLDVQLSELYSRQLASQGPQATRVQQTQRSWLAQRNQCGADASCLFNAYSERMTQLGTSAPTMQAGSTQATAQASAISATPQATATNPMAASPGIPSASQSSSASPGPNLQALAAASPLLKPLVFEYDKGIPILTAENSAQLFTLMGFAAQDPASSNPDQECRGLREILSDNAIKQFFTGMSYGCWKGNNEFERADNRNNFYAQHFETIKASAPQPPFRFALIGKNELGSYDTEKGHFTLISEPGQIFSARFNTGQFRPSISHGTNFPGKLLEMDETAARALLAKVGSWPQLGRSYDKTPQTGTRIVSTLALIDVLSIDWEARRVDVRLVSMGLYDPTLQEQVYKFAVGPSFDTLVRGDIPERFNVPAPSPLDSIYAFVQTLDDETHPVTEGHWRRFFNKLVERDKRLYAALPTTPSPDDLRLPVLPRGAQFQPRYQAHIEKWARAYRAGLSDTVQQVVAGLPRDAGNPNGFNIYTFHNRVALSDSYTDLLNAEGLSREHATILNFDDRAFLVTTPAQLTHYSLNVPASATKGRSSDGWQTKTVFRVGTIKPVKDHQGRRLYILPLIPLSLTLSQGDTVVASREFVDASQLEDSLVAAQTERTPTVDTQEPLGMSPAMLDLILLKGLGNELPDETVMHMAARRWQLESTGKPVAGGSFFVSGAHKPSPAELAELTDKFRAWGASRLPDGPLRLHVAGQSDRGQWEDFECVSTVQQLLSHPDRLRYRNDISPVRQAIQHHDAHTYTPLSNAFNKLDHKFKQAQAGRSNWSPPEDYDRALLNIAVNIRHVYHPLGEYCQTTNDNAAYSDPVSSYLYIDHPMPRAPGNNTRNYYVATLDIAGMRLAPTEPHYTDLLPEAFVKQYKLRPPQLTEGQAAIIETKLIDVAYFNSVNHTEIERFSVDESRSVQNLLASLPSNEPTQAKADGPRGFEIVGLQIGMSMDQAEAVIRKHMDVGRVLESKHTDSSGPLLPLTSGKLFISKDGFEYIAIMDEPPAISGKVIAAWRRWYLPPESMLVEDVVAALREKYGDPTPQEPVRQGLNRWRTMAGHQCSDFTRGDDLPMASWTENGTPVKLQLADKVPITAPRMPSHYRNPLQEHGQTDCGPMMAAYINFDASKYVRQGNQVGGMMDYLEQSITDVGPYVEAFKANREARIRKTDGPGDQKPMRPRL